MERVLHFFVVFTLLMIEFGHAQISLPKIGMLMSKTACIKPWKYFSICGKIRTRKIPNTDTFPAVVLSWNTERVKYICRRALCTLTCLLYQSISRSCCLSIFQYFPTVLALVVQLACTCSKSTIETLEKSVKYVQS